MAHQSSSRLHRLLTLLDTGSTQATRFAAARSIGDVAKIHPQDLSSLLRKVSHYLHSKNWDTRVAAARAIGAIAENVKHNSLTELIVCVERKVTEAGISTAIEDLVALPNFHPNFTAGLPFQRFDITRVLEFGSLLASGGQEYDLAGDNTTKTASERLSRQKHNLRRRLGLDVCEQFMDVNDMIKDEDLLVDRFDSYENGINHRHCLSQSSLDIRHLVANLVPGFVSKRPSARELNLLKRKAKNNSKDQTKGWSEDGDPEASCSENEMPSMAICPSSLTPSKVFVDDDSIEDIAEHYGVDLWPFHIFVEQLLLDIFDPTWEVRHGSAMALREILTFQGGSAGVIMLPSISENVQPLDHYLSDSHRKSNDENVIDLNVQVPLEELEPKLKRPKLENLSSPRVNDVQSLVTDCTSNVFMKVDGRGLDLAMGRHNGETGINNAVTAGCGSYPNGIDWVTKSFEKNYLCIESAHIVESGSHCENKVSTEKIDVIKNIPAGSELMILVKLARHSWLKNCEFLQDCAIRFLCVLSIDRFGDYISDQVIAPVRETCAQSLGAVFKYMHPRFVNETLNILIQMQRRPEWEIRHSSLLGIKYLVAVRQEMIHDMLGCVLPACKAGLEDPDDDVRAVAADALIPATGAIVSLSNQTLHSIIMLLWDILLDLDDLSPSTSSVMNLLAEIYSHEDVAPKMLNASWSLENDEFDLNEGACAADVSGGRRESPGNPFMLSSLAPRLWPFMRHNITSVRYSAIRTLERLLEAGYKRILSKPSLPSFWPSFILGDTLRIVFQNLLLEPNKGILQCSESVWKLLLQCPMCDLEVSARSYMSSWIELVATPFGSPLDVTKMYWPAALPRKSHFRAAAKMKAVNLENDSLRSIIIDPARGALMHEHIGDPSSNTVKIIVGSIPEKSVTHTRVITSTALGLLAAKLPVESLYCVIDPLWQDLTSLSGVQRQVASMILISWFKERKQLSGPNGIILAFVNQFKVRLLDLLTCFDPAFPTKDAVVPYAELSRTYAKMRSEANHLFWAAEAIGAFKTLMPNLRIDVDCLNIDDAINFASKLNPENIDVCDSNESGGKHVMDDIEVIRQQLLSTAGYLKCVQGNLHVTVSALVAAAVVWMSELPGKLNPIILPLMASIKREQEEMMQQKAAEALSELISHCVGRKPGPNDKLIKNICTLICMDPCETPQAGLINSMAVIEDHNLLSFESHMGEQNTRVGILAGGEDRSRIEGFISRRGSEFALMYLCEKFGASLFEKLPKLWECLTEVLKPCSPGESIPSNDMQNTIAVETTQDPQILINNIQVVGCIATMLDQSLKSKLLSLLPCIFQCVRHSHVAVRLSASRCITSMARATTMSVMESVIAKAIPMLGDTASIHARQGAGMVVSLLIKGLGVELVPYAPLLVIPLLRCMNDSDHSVRKSVTHSFAALVPLLPLARGICPPTELCKDLSKNTEDAKFLEQLLDNSHIDDYKLSAELKVTLRKYQQEGINWLSFLRRFKLHGILCDDMGLGKTLQAAAIVASDIVEYRALNSNEVPSISLIICPSTLVGHWAYEIEKYIDTSVINTFQYVGSVHDRIAARDCFIKHNIIITSYDIIRKDIDYLGQLLWNYCILDEGHVIKNAKSKITCAVKQLKAEHRLILSGTPIQNNILDLWSLFDFLMPGFLGTEKQFHSTYGKPVVASRDSKCSAKDAEAGVLALEALHKQVMPFLLRRTKDQVLSDLPEKIIQDRYCDLSPIQLKLYEQFSGSHVRKEISTIVTEEENAAPKASSHVFQALQYLLKLCSHPLLVVGEKLSDSVSCLLSELVPSTSEIVSELHKLRHSPKLVALQEILEECGIGIDASSESSASVGQHRVLIFAQHKAFLDIIERDLFHTFMKNVTYLRLDGSVEPEKRFEIVKAFNSDPTIDVLLLTTHVGGLGLNLTSADTLVFMEHDWNPMRDHQAMDRAHRIGQRKVVNVHRLIMRGTLEEKVMSLQKFKLSVANAVINSDNASFKTMNTDQLLDLFTPAEIPKKGKKSDGSDEQCAKKKGGVGGILSGLEELWDESQYTEEYDLTQFVAKLND